MADELDQVRTLRAEVDRLTTANEKLRGESTRRKAALAAVGAALGVQNAEELRTVVGELQKAGGYRKVAGELDQLRKATPEQLQRERDAARAELRTIRHRDAVKGLYGELGVRPEVPAERLMAVAGYRPESDAFDAESFKGQVAALKASDPYLFGAGGEPAGDQSRSTPPAWAGRGASGQPGTGMTFTEAQLRDPMFMCSQAAKLPPPTA